MKVLAAEEAPIAEQTADPKKNIQICCHEGSPVLFCEDARLKEP